MNPDQTKHTVLIERIRLGDAKAFAELYSVYFVSVYRFSYKFLKSREQAQECTQLTFIKIWERRQHIDASLNFKSYIFTIVKNCVLKAIEQSAKVNRFAELVQLEYNSNLRDESPDHEDLEKIANEILQQLPPQRQLVFKLCKLEGKSYDEVALDLGISSGTVRDHMFKASKTIRKHLSSNRLLFIATLLFLFR